MSLYTSRYLILSQHLELFKEISSWIHDYEFKLIGTNYRLVIIDHNLLYFSSAQKVFTLDEIWDDLPEPFQNFFIFHLDLFR